MDQVICAALPVEMLDNSHKIFYQPHRPFCCRRSLPRYRPYPERKNNCRYIWRLCNVTAVVLFQVRSFKKLTAKAWRFAAVSLPRTLLHAEWLKNVKLNLSYTIGIAEPVSIYVDTFNTNKCPVEETVSAIKSKEDLLPE